MTTGAASRPARASASFALPDEAATEQLGGRFGRACQADSLRAQRVYLSGDLGAGKTTLVRGFLHALGVAGAIRSPTYGLFTLYEAASLPALHADLYRLTDPVELLYLGLDDYDRAGWVWLVEWPERAGGRLPPVDLELQLSSTVETHALRVDACSAGGAEWLSRVLNSATSRT